MGRVMSAARGRDASDRFGLKRHIRDIPDFPSTGIVFRDITTLLQRGPVFRKVIRAMAAPYRSVAVDAVAAIESRGLIIGSALAYVLGIGVVPIRKKGKLPHKTFTADYTLEYGSDSLEIHQDGLARGSRVLVVDDLLATGGTTQAAIHLIQRCGAEVVEAAFLIELRSLKGRERLAPCPVTALVQYE